MPEGTLINVNCPGGEPTGVEVTHLGKRLYNDELKLVEEDEDAGRRRYQIYGFEPSFEDEQGSDLSASPRAGSRSPRSTSTSPTTAASRRLKRWDLERCSTPPASPTTK